MSSFKSYRRKPKIEHLTNSTGAPLYNDISSITTQQPDFTVTWDTQLIEKLSHFNRERIPERVVHAKGAGAFGVFEVTNDLSMYTRASFLSHVGKRTPVLVRFSTVGGEKGSADSARDPRGFAVKFYTDEGNYDIVGNNTPVFFIRDALKFPDFIHTQKRNPVTNLKDPNAVWDFFSLTPESMHQVTILYSSRGTPKNFRHMHGFGTHTFMWYTDKNDYIWVKLNFITDQGIENFNREEAIETAGKDPDYSTRDLYNAIEKGNYPSWRLYAQMMTKEQAETYRFNPFDVTKVWYQADFPYIPVGKMTLNEIPLNFFNQVEQAAFSPGNFVPGVGPSPDKMLNARVFAYPDAQRHRIGPNFNQLPVNSPINAKVANYQRDGSMNLDNAGFPNYFPNTFNGPAPDPDLTPPKLSVRGTVARHEMPFTPIDLEQPRRLFSSIMDDKEREMLIHNICSDMKDVLPRIQYRQTALFYLTDPDYGTGVAEGLNLDIAGVKKLAEMTQEERVNATSGMLRNYCW